MNQQRPNRSTRRGAQYTHLVQGRTERIRIRRRRVASEGSRNPKNVSDLIRTRLCPSLRGNRPSRQTLKLENRQVFLLPTRGPFNSDKQVENRARSDQSSLDRCDFAHVEHHFFVWCCLAC